MAIRWTKTSEFGGGLEQAAAADQGAVQHMGVGQVAVMRDREAAELEIRVERLDVAKNGVAGGGVAVVADGDAAGQLLDHPGVAEIVADQAHAAMGVEAGAVEAGDAGGFLAAMLQGMQAQRGDRGGVGHVPDAEDAAFLVQGVVVEAVSRLVNAIGDSSYSRSGCLPVARPCGVARSKASAVASGRAGGGSRVCGR